MNTFIIAEAGVNHNGSESLALDLVEAAAAAGANAIKFQSFDADKLVSVGTVTAEYQKRQTGSDDQYSMLKALELDRQAHEAIFDKCVAAGIEFMSTPFDLDTARFLLGLGMERIKIPSGELTNLPFLAELAALGKPMILSTGMGSMEEVVDAVDTIAAVVNEQHPSLALAKRLVVLHCTSNYPTRDEDINLLAMQSLARNLGLPVGYSDHSTGILVAECATALGARVIEKHFTLDRNLPGPDHQASLEPNEFESMVSRIRRVETILGDGDKMPRASELAVRDVVRRSVCLAHDKSAGETLGVDDLVLLRPGTGIQPKDLPRVVGSRMRHDSKAGSVLTWQILESCEN